MSNTLTVKAFLRDPEVECRRFKLNDEQRGSVEKLKEKVKEVFVTLQDKPFTITYTDEDGDDVVIGTDEELEAAVEEVTKRDEDLLKVNIKKQQDKGTANDPSCNSCKKDLLGVHFQCLQCPSYWLCQNCEKKGEHYHHSMMRLRQPLPTEEQIRNQFAPWISMWKNMMGCSDKGDTKQDYCRDQSITFRLTFPRKRNTDSCGHSSSERCDGMPQAFNLSEFLSKLMEGCGPAEQGATGGSAIACDGCKAELNKINFKCLQCANYHLCVGCESKGVHQEHNMMRFPFPMPSQEEMMKHLQPWLSMLYNMGAQSKCEGSACNNKSEPQGAQQRTNCPMFGFGDFSQFFSGGCRDSARHQLPEEILHQIFRAGTSAAEIFTAMGAGYHH